MSVEAFWETHGFMFGDDITVDEIVEVIKSSIGQDGMIKEKDQKENKEKETVTGFWKINLPAAARAISVLLSRPVNWNPPLWFQTPPIPASSHSPLSKRWA